MEYVELITCEDPVAAAAHVSKVINKCFVSLQVIASEIATDVNEFSGVLQAIELPLRPGATVPEETQWLAAKIALRIVLQLASAAQYRTHVTMLVNARPEEPPCE